MNTKHTTATLALLATGLLFLGEVVLAQDTEWIDTIASEILRVVGTAVPVLVGLALALFIWGGVLFIVSAGNDQSRKEGQTRMFWGLIALFVIVSVWGLVQLAQAIFGFEYFKPPERPGATVSQSLVEECEQGVYFSVYAQG